MPDPNVEAALRQMGQPALQVAQPLGEPAIVAFLALHIWQKGESTMTDAVTLAAHLYAEAVVQVQEGVLRGAHQEQHQEYVARHREAAGGGTGLIQP